MNIRSRPRGWKLKKDVAIVKCHLNSIVVEWIDQYCDSRQRARSDVGTNALYIYFYTYSWADKWVTIEETLEGPDIDSRNDYLVSGYVPKTYLSWFDSLEKNILELNKNPSPEYWQQLRDKYSTRVYSVGGRAMHLRRALIIYYKLCQERPELVEVDFDALRPENYFWERHDFANQDYLFAYTAKVGEVLGDISKGSLF